MKDERNHRKDEEDVNHESGDMEEKETACPCQDQDKSQK